MTALALISVLGLALALLYAGLTCLNLALFTRPARAASPATEIPAVSVLIPARDEAARITTTLAAVLASRDVTLEVIVLDDGSADDTAAIVTALAAADPRLRLVSGAALPAGMNGKQHACAQLAEAAGHDRLLFVDADVTLAPTAIADSLAWMERRGLQLLSGFPRQVGGSLGTRLLVPMIHVLLLGYLPLLFARFSNHPMFAAGCGQYLLIDRAAYHASGGHRRFVGHMHDGMRLPRLLREQGYRTDIFNARDLAACRSYADLARAWRGFSKDATDGMATPVGLPIWTLLLFGGHLLPWLTLAGSLGIGDPRAAVASVIALSAVFAARGLLARAAGQSPSAVALHPAAVVVTLALQWQCLYRARRGRSVGWRGRDYPA